tara:strand:+ start:40 stop:408 length:369 start_codon:yes stop_codon:yes gene_type:complete
MPGEKLLFVYNAEAGVVNGLADTLHKLLKPETYACSLCKITHGLLGEKKLWKDFRKNSGYITEFYHKQEFLKAFASKFLPQYQFPLVLLVVNDAMQVLIHPHELDTLENSRQLIAMIKERLT